MEAIARAICDDQRLQLVKKVGEGSFKQTYLVQDERGQFRALKIFRADNSPERTQRELEAMLRCDHPNIAKLEHVSIFTHGRGAFVYIIEEYLGGGTLTGRLVNGCIPIPQLLDLAVVLVDAVNHIASKNLVHRDLKPDNIMFRTDGSPVVVDFGLVRDLGGTSLTKTWLLQGPGTPYFAAPEQLNNNKVLVDWRTDQFGLGVVLAVCAFGEHPYANDGDKAGDTVARVAARQLPTQAFLAKVRTSGLEPLAKMVQPWPFGRYRTPEELSTAWQKVGVQ